jgi:translation initiation factor 2 alpha subunit (eIF-2alpha)
MNKDIIEGLTILYKYLKPNKNNIKVDDEEIIVKLSLKKVSPEDYQQLKLLNWEHVKKNTSLYRESHFYYLLDSI